MPPIMQSCSPWSVPQWPAGTQGAGPGSGNDAHKGGFLCRLSYRVPFLSLSKSGPLCADTWANMRCPWVPLVTLEHTYNRWAPRGSLCELSVSNGHGGADLSSVHVCLSVMPVRWASLPLGSLLFWALTHYPRLDSDSVCNQG